METAYSFVQPGGRPGRVVVAMSGGVDSSVAAALLKESGHEVIGVTLHLWDAEGQHMVGRCCAPEDREDARRTCEVLGIPHYVIDERSAFKSEVVEPFVSDYVRGVTPSPCVACNRTVKLAPLVRLADTFGAPTVATGHYARLDRSAGSPRLLRGADRVKDQSYFLFGVPDAVLVRLVFPLGDMTKAEVRSHGRRLELPNAGKAESQELCFVPDGKVGAFVERHSPVRPVPGAVRDELGSELGRHDGVHRFTIGQRRGLGLGGGRARYVTRIDAETHDVVVGSGAALHATGLRATRVRWSAGAPSVGPFDALVRIRYVHEPAPARVTATAEGFEAVFREPQRAITPGQAVVVYRGDEVIAGGFIV